MTQIYPREMALSNGRVIIERAPARSPDYPKPLINRNEVREITINKYGLNSSNEDVHREFTGVDIRNQNNFEDYLLNPTGGQIRGAYSAAEGLDDYTQKGSQDDSSKEMERSNESVLRASSPHTSSTVATEPTPQQPRSGVSTYDQLKIEFAKKTAFKAETRSGKRIGFYRLILDIGRGNFSKVKLATHTMLNTEVAVKVIDRRKFDAKTRRLLSQELTNMERLDHPHIIQLFEVHEVAHRWFLMMEYASAGELHSYLKRHGRMENAAAKRISSQIVSALKHMHGRGVIHRDLKAENVLLMASNSIKIGDFGFSKNVSLDDALTTFCGSPPYAAPELFVADCYIGPAVDMWAFGVLLAYMVSGNLPFRGDTIAEIKRLILESDYTLPITILPECKSLIQSLLCRNVDQRFKIEQVQQADWYAGHEWTEMSNNDHPSTGRITDEQVRGLLNEWWEVDEIEMNHALGEGPKSSLTGMYRILRMHGRKFLEGKKPLTLKKRNQKKNRESSKPSDSTTSTNRKKRNQRSIPNRSEEVTTVDLRDRNTIKGKMGRSDEKSSKACTIL